jgi:hypothetical protein
VLRFFEYEHLPEYLQPISKACCEIAMQMVDTLPDDPELTVGLRKLLEAKDAFVRTMVATRDKQ